MTADLHTLTPRTTPGIKTRQAIHRMVGDAVSPPLPHHSSPPQTTAAAISSSSVAGREPAIAPTSLGAPSNDRPIRSALPYRGDPPMQMLVMAFAIAVAALIVVVWNLWPAR